MPRVIWRSAAEAVFASDIIRGAFADDDARSHRVSRSDARHNGAVCDPQIIDSIDSQVRIDNRHRVAAHFAVHV